MKKIFNLILMFGLLVTGFVSCGNPASSGAGNNGAGNSEPDYSNLTEAQKKDLYQQYIGIWHNYDNGGDYEFRINEFLYNTEHRAWFNVKGQLLSLSEYLEKETLPSNIKFSPVLIFKDEVSKEYTFLSDIKKQGQEKKILGQVGKVYAYELEYIGPGTDPNPGSNPGGSSGNLSSFAGTYSFTGTDSQKSGSWTFKEDGTYTYSGQSQSGVDGTYTVSGSSITMHTTSGSIKIDETLNISTNGNQVTFTTTATPVSHIFQVYFNATTSKSLTLTKS